MHGDAKQRPVAHAAPPGGEPGTAPHPTSIAVWSVPSPVVVRRRFTARVGVKCAAGCPLAGRSVVVRDETGADIGRGRLGETPAPGTEALYAADVALPAPASEGVHTWSAGFDGAEPEPAPPANGAAGPESAPAHANATATFSFRVILPPEHIVTVTVRSRDADTPLAGAEVRVGLHRGSTDAGGRARIDVRTGSYDLHVRKPGHAPHTDRVTVTGDLTLQVGMSPASDPDLDEDQVWM